LEPEAVDETGCTGYGRPKEMPEAILRLLCQTVPTILC
jgi:hypothetical protein